MASPDTKNKNYLAQIARVKKARDFTYGADMVRSYILRLPGQASGSDEYKEFVKRAYYLPAMGRTIDAFTGMVMSNGAKIEDLPEAYKMYADDITNDGEPLGSFAGAIVRENITAGRGAIIVDYPDRSDAVNMTKKAAEDLGLRPYAKSYKTEDILDWHVRADNGVRMLSHLRLREDYEAPGADEWESVIKTQIRVMDLDPITGFYRVRIFRQTEKSSGWELFGPVRYPEMNGKKFPYIPAWVFGPSSLDPSIVEAPPLIDMADVSEAHLNNSALRENALMWCGCPTLFIFGRVPMGADGQPLPIRIGGPAGVILPEGGTAELLEATGDALGALKDGMSEKRDDMAAIGARILIDSGASNISTETAKLERVGEHSVLSEISLTTARALTDMFRVLLTWAGLDESLADKVAISLNTDFVPKGMTTGELAEWLKGVQSNLVPLSIMFYYLKSRGVLPEGMTEEQYREELIKDADELSLMGAGDEEDDGNPDDPPKDDDEEEDDEEAEAA